ncbi:hypothetical protein [Arthrobacter sp. UM1]|uniref:hypothetical protein n=1 Tax=Arthrobacter sp. UM1 TaxID=2766776 RepID=UPI001CF717FB|nr:hypothetical protein [Arthrobacter sp. UM1]MCB4208989.1 hypothetical protein [Arthrobacter sp. UM1]
MNLYSEFAHEKTNRCLRESGLPAEGRRFTERRPRFEDRIYGIWHESNAAKYGYVLPPHPSDNDDQSQGSGSAELREYERCSKEFFNKHGDIEGFDFTSLNEKLRLRAYAAAVQDPQWNRTVSAWKSCIRDAGYSIKDDPDTWSPEGTLETTPESIRIALADIACKKKHNVIQTLADLEAAYQDTVITENEAALKQRRERIDTQIAEAKAYLAQNPTLETPTP